jgi:DNA-binding response OmpR family regulator
MTSMLNEIQRPKVLVIDDEDDVRAVMALTLSSWGYDVESVSTGSEAQQSIYQNSTFPEFLPHIIVLDLNLPGIDGVQFCQWMRETYPSLKIPILVVSADDSEKQKILLFETGADDYLTKPFDASDLRGHVDSLYRMSCSENNSLKKEGIPLEVIPSTSVMFRSLALSQNELREKLDTLLIQAKHSILQLYFLDPSSLTSNEENEVGTSVSYDNALCILNDLIGLVHLSKRIRRK